MDESIDKNGISAESVQPYLLIEKHKKALSTYSSSYESEKVVGDKYHQEEEHALDG